MLRRAPAVLLVALLGLTAGCGGEEEVPDDGTQGVPLAGLGAQVESAGVEVLAADSPTDATADDVVSALESAQVAGVGATRPGDVAEGVVAFDPTATAGLLSVVDDDAASVVVLVFAEPAAAAVFAAGAPEVFADDATDGDKVAYLAGNVVAYAAAGPDQSARVRRGLDALDGPGDPGDPGSPSTS